MKIIDLINHINRRAYGGNLEIAYKVESVNCKEWESEKSFFEKKLKRKNLPMATRYYVKTKNIGDKKLEEHSHEGHIDMRPISRTMSDAFLPLPKKERFFITCRKSYKSDDPNNPTIITVPYAIPDKRISLCSPVTMWIILMTLSYEFGKAYVSLVDIYNYLLMHKIGKKVNIHDYDKFFKKLTYSPLYYYGKKNHRESEDYVGPMDSEVLYAYIESEIPVYLVFKWNDLMKELNCGKPSEDYHSVVAIGHTLDKQGGCSSFIIHDVNCAPFLEISKEMINENLQEAMVLLPEGIIRYDSHQRDALIKFVIWYDENIDKIFKDLKKIMIRPFLMRSQRVKFWYINKDLYPSMVRKIYSKADFPRYVWVFEIDTPELKENNECIGQIIIDATTSNPVLINFPKFRLWYRNKKLRYKKLSRPAFKSLPLFRLPYDAKAANL